MSTKCVFTPKEGRNSALLFASIAHSQNHRFKESSRVLLLGVSVRISCCYGWCVLSELSATAKGRGGMGLPLSRRSHTCPCDAFRRQKRRGEMRRHGASKLKPLWNLSARYKITACEHFDPQTDERRSCIGPSPCITLITPPSDSLTELITRQIEIGSAHAEQLHLSIIQCNFPFLVSPHSFWWVNITTDALRPSNSCN